MPLRGSLGIERLARVSRAGFYRSLQERAPVEEDLEVRSVIQQIAVEHRRRYGYPFRRISAQRRYQVGSRNERGRRIPHLITTCCERTIAGIMFSEYHGNKREPDQDADANANQPIDCCPVPPPSSGWPPRGCQPQIEVKNAILRLEAFSSHLTGA